MNIVSTSPSRGRAGALAPPLAALIVCMVIGFTGQAAPAAEATAPSTTSTPLTPSAPLSLHDAVRAALARSSAVAAPEQAARAAREMAVAAAQRPDPTLRLALENVPIQGPDRFALTREAMTARAIGVAQTFTRDAKLQARAARYQREAGSALAEQQLRRANVARDVAIAWFELRAQEQRVQRLQAIRDEAQLQVQGSDAAVRAGRAAQADALAAREAVAQWQQAIVAAQGEAAMARHTLRRWTGAADDQPLAAGPPLHSSRVAPSDAAGRVADQPLPQMLAARIDNAAAEAEVARQEREPDWSVELAFAQRGPAYANMVSLAVSLPLPWDRPQRQDRELAARLARVAELQAEREEVLREQAVEVRRWLEAWRAGLAQLELIDTQRAPLLQQRIDAALAAYRGASLPLAAVLEARRSLLALQLERIGIELDTARNWARLEFLWPEATVDVGGRP